ncbi:hypothetical protein MHI18_01505 [Peribacillus sp. FSL H8-0477]|uniref:hypothetical protein n=1 Tax=Peribacillus sp. FSL H8-0477 TaxID=2921388 RepID=UPI0030FCB59C
MQLKTVIQSLAVSLGLHVIFLFGTFFIGYIKTRNYQPDSAKQWESVDTLQNEAAFGFSVSPLFFLFTFIGLAVLSGIVILFYRKKSEPSL